MQGTHVPAIDLDRFEREYDAVVATDAPLAWRMISVSLWWKKCVLGESLETRTSEQREAAAATLTT
jgi:hypothetical protein